MSDNPFKFLHFYGDRPKHISADDFYNQITQLESQCTRLNCFVFEGRCFSGDAIGTIREYIRQQPSKTFYVWLIDNGLEITQTNK
jgi:hypothetical protein